MKKAVIFDLDGTLADTSPGILNSHIHTLKATNLPIPAIDELRKLIGGPLLETYKKAFGFSEEDAVKAVKIYREYYATEGVNQAEIYDGISQMLENLKNAGCKLMVATLKAQKFARPLLEKLNVAKYFDYICGVDDNDTKTKTTLLLECIEFAGLPKEDVVLVGDSEFDCEGAKNTKIGFIGVTYGFGYKKEMKIDGIVLCHSPEEIKRTVLCEQRREK